LSQETPPTEQSPSPKRRRKRGGRRTRKSAAQAEKKPADQAEKKPAEVKKKRAAPAKKRPAAQTASPQPFGGISLSDVMLAALSEAAYDEPTPVQAGLIPGALEGKDLMGQAQTGTGKTAAFAVPILERLESRRENPLPQALVLAPTRELAVQVRDEFVKLSAGRRARTVAVYGGKPIRRQTDQLREGVQVVVGTPGRVLDHIGRGTLRLEGLRVVVLDEADRMLDIGFRPDIEKILRRCPSQRQTLLFSATIPPPVMRLAQRYMHDPEMLDFSPKAIDVETIEQFYFTVDPERKFDLLVQLIARDAPAQAIIFCRTKRGTEKIYRRLARKVEGAATIHGDLSQPVRDAVMARFRQRKIRYLVATDVVGRGIDVTSISHIVNYDVPQFCDDYVHRVGRTGRMGREGVAYTFITPEEGNELTRIEMRINRQLKRDELAGFESFNKPQSEPAAPPATAKPVFGRRTRRTRRAL
jgi:ATP-dependent RNA helicase DeaD